LIKPIEKMKVTEISSLTREQKHFYFNESVIRALKISISDGNTGPANYVLKLLPLVTKKAGAQEALIKYFETWGNLYFNKSSVTLKHSQRHVPPWSNNYEAQIRASAWEKLIDSPPRSSPSVIDADKEFRGILSRLQRISQDSKRTILHPALLSKVQEVLLAYGRTDEWTIEDKRGRTLFDESVKRTTTRASKYAKGL
jgi:hypothetical protein